MTITSMTSKGLTLDQRRTLNKIPWGPARIAAVAKIHADTPKWYNPDGEACCRLNNTSCEKCPSCA